MKIEREFIGKTYDDFLFRPRKGIADSRSDIALATRVTKQLTVQLPVVSANMDSVTASSMAKAMALEVCCGVIHRAMSI